VRQHEIVAPVEAIADLQTRGPMLAIDEDDRPAHPTDSITVPGRHYYA